MMQLKIKKKYEKENNKEELEKCNQIIKLLS